ncbi:hypothetical protein PTTG_11965 [Puccinia triticina 1-1 BBBD Race 1]|uniref:Uncharacterized protein n=1 Tax=Puccinia triticina (isolate 1-1 / race 1 (BBBD)) TaxID=630390 RepID=A0A180GKN7_PUCT1|nr:hypothetical protein PTTG_11965 [Puccinia triticina 1-1 BBBD Race 1]
MKKTVLIAVSDWNWRRVEFSPKAGLALSLLAHWYSIKSDLKSGGLDLTKQPEIYWKLISKIHERSREHLEQDRSVIYDNKYKTPSTTDWQKELTNSIANSIKPLLKDEVSGIPAKYKKYIEEKLRDYLFRSRFDLYHGKIISLNGLPFQLIQVAQAQNHSGYQEFFIGLREIERRRLERFPKLRLLQRRINSITGLLGIIHSIACRSLGNKVLSNCDDLISWFFEVLFNQTAISLPIFGWVRIKLPIDLQAPEIPFSPVHKYLSMKLNELGNQSSNEAIKISITLFEFWYREILASQSNQVHPKDCKFPSYKDILYGMAVFLQIKCT